MRSIFRESARTQRWDAYIYGEVDNVCHVHHTSITTVRAMDDFRRVIAINDFAHVLPFQDSINELNAN